MRISLVGVVALTLTTVVFAEYPGDDAPPLDRPTVVKVGDDYQHGPNINIDDLLGKSVVVNFWASW